MATTTSAFDITRYLTDDTTIVNYLNDCLEEGGSRLFLVGVGDVARARGMTDLAASTGITRAALYKALGEEGNPAFATIERVLEGLGFGLAVVRKATPIRKRVAVPAGKLPVMRAAAKRHSPSTKTEKKPSRRKPR